MPLRLNLDLDEMTYGNLFDFSDAARSSGKSRNDKVEQVLAVNNDEIVDHFSVEVEGLATGNGPRIIEAEDAIFWSDTLEKIINSDGDARSDISELRAIRDALR